MYRLTLKVKRPLVFRQDGTDEKFLIGFEKEAWKGFFRKDKRAN